MRNGWATTLEQVLHSPTFPMWITLAAAGFFAVILLITLIRAEKTVANGALTVITLLAIGIAVAATVRKFGPFDDTPDAAFEGRPVGQAIASVPALSCLDGLAGEGVETPCERSLFASADIAAAAVSYTAAQISRLAPLDRPQTTDQQLLRKVLERDRYGLVAQVLTTRDRCTENDCKLFQLFADPSRIKANMRDRAYDATIARYALAWAAVATTPSLNAGLAPSVASVPTGKPSTIDFPNAASIPPVNIMTPEPMQAAPAAPKPAAPANIQPARPPAAKKQAVTTPAGPPKRPAAAAPPTPIAPAASDEN